jgi:hypothetical protein
LDRGFDGVQGNDDERSGLRRLSGLTS